MDLHPKDRQALADEIERHKAFFVLINTSPWEAITRFRPASGFFDRLTGLLQLAALWEQEKLAGQQQLDDMWKQHQDDRRRINELLKQGCGLADEKDRLINELARAEKDCACLKTTQVNQAGFIKRLEEQRAELTAQHDKERVGRIAAEEKLQLTLRKLSTPQARRLAILRHCDEVEERLREMTAENTQMGVALAKANKKKWRASKKIQELQSKIDELHITLHEERDKTRDAVADAARLRDLLDKELKKPKPASNYELTRQLIMAQNEKQQLSQELDIGQRAKVGLEMSYDILHETALELREFASRALNLNLAYHDKRVELAELLEATKWLLRAEDNRPSS